MPRSHDIVAAVDVGAGSGAKLGLFDVGPDGDAPRLIAESDVPVARYGGSPETMADALAGALRALATGIQEAAPGLGAVGIACPGLFKSDGTAITVSNLGFLSGASLPSVLGERLNVPLAIANDADAGGLAEWALAREEILYWILGGGWGGAWVSADGRVMFPSVDWDGNDSSLHPANEPGYAVPLEKDALARVFAEENDERASFNGFEDILRRDLGDGALSGPCGDKGSIRAETLVSGPGRVRVFRAFLEAGPTCDDALTPEEERALEGLADAGAVVTALGERGMAAAVRTDRVFGQALGEAGAKVIAAAERDGCPRGAPVHVAGGPAKALHLFGPDAEERLRAKGFSNRLLPSRVEAEGRNANLLGAAVMAMGLVREP